MSRLDPHRFAKSTQLLCPIAASEPLPLRLVHHAAAQLSRPYHTPSCHRKTQYSSIVDIHAFLNRLNCPVHVPDVTTIQRSHSVGEFGLVEILAAPLRGEDSSKRQNLPIYPTYASISIEMALTLLPYALDHMPTYTARVSQHASRVITAVDPLQSTP